LNIARKYLLFASKPESVQDLFSLATAVAEAVEVEEQCELLTTTTQQGELTGLFLGAWL
jgi:hypothetical protein